MHQHRKAGEELAKIQGEGMLYNLKVASWETAGIYEVWEMIMDKDAEVPPHEHHKSYETFFVTEGSVEVTLAGNTFVAKAGDIIQVPPYMPHSMLLLEETTFISIFYNYKFYNAMQERNMLKEHNPEILADEEFIKEFGYRHDSHRL